MRKRIFEIIELSKNNDVLSYIYDVFMMLTIMVSLTPLCFKQTNKILYNIELVCLVIFIIDYILRFITADYKYKKKSIMSFVRYPFGFLAIIDILTILPSVTVLNNGFKVLRVFRFARTFRVFRALKVFRYSKTARVIISVFKRSKESLMAVCTLAIAYIVMSALIIFNVEPESFNTFFDAIYWATVSLTTVGYGDIYPVTTVGRIVTMFSSLFGIAIVALPAGIITAGYMNSLNEDE